MKKLILFFLLLSGVAYGQSNNTTNTKFTNGLAVPNGATQKPASGLTAGALSYVTGAGLYVYNGSSWELLGLSSGGVTSFNGRTGAVTPVIGDYSSFYTPLTRSLTINGATQTLAADRTWTITANTTNGLTNGYGLTGGVFDGSVARTWVADTSSVAGLVSKLRLATNLTGYVKKATTITINGVTQDLSDNRIWAAGTVTSVGVTPGTGISVSGSPITSSGNITITNTAPDQTVTLTGGTGISTSGTYPNFTITNTSPSPSGLQDSLTKKANRTFDNVASGAIAKSKVDTSATGLQTVSNFFPKGDTRYAKIGDIPTLGTSAISLGGTANGLSYSSGNYRLHKVTATAGGVLTTGTDTIAGDKNFANNIAASAVSAANISSTASNGISATFTNNASSFETFRATNNGSGLIASFRNSGGEVASILNSGGATFNGSVGIGGAASTFKLEVRDAVPALFVVTSDATTASYAGVSFRRNTKLNGNGNGLSFSALNSSDSNAEYGYFGSIIESNTASSENGAFVWSPIVAGVRTEKMRLSSNGNLTLASLTGTGTRMVVADNTGILSTQAIPGGGGGSVTGVAVASANGFGGTSDGNAVVPTLTLSTSVTGVLKGNGTAISAATAGTDYLAPTGSGAGLSNVVNSITGTSNQVIASASTGAVTLSLPQSIATTSSPTFGAMTITGNITAANLGTASSYTAQANTGALTIPLRDLNGDFSAGTITASLAGNAGTATALQTARNIQGVSFNGTADINPINGTGFVKASGTTLSYDNTTYAPLNSPTFTGTPSLPTGTIAVTQSANNNSTAVATTAYVDNAVSSLSTNSGQYNPTYTSGTNTSGITGSNVHYMRVGNQVTVHGRASLTTTGAGSSNFTISLPVASSLSVGTDLLGNASATNNSTNPVLYAESTTDTAVCEFTADAGTTMTIYYSFMYTINSL